MLETAAYETERNRRGTAVLVTLVSLYSIFAVAIFPTFDTSGVDLEAVMEGYPDAIREAFGLEALGTIEGFLAGELYNFVWVILLGVYFAYRAGGLIASDIEHDRLDLLLSLPVSRSTLLLEKFSSLLVPIFAINIGAGAVIYASILIIGESIDPIALSMVHFLSIPYFCLASSIGLTLSVLVDRADIAQRAALGVIFSLYLVESIAGTSDELEVLQVFSPTNYYDPTAILVHNTYALLDAGILVLGSIGLILVAQTIFRRRDI